MCLFMLITVYNPKFCLYYTDLGKTIFNFMEAKCLKQTLYNY